jgi:hypothetical protein
MSPFHRRTELFLRFDWDWALFAALNWLANLPRTIGRAAARLFRAD